MHFTADKPISCSLGVVGKQLRYGRSIIRHKVCKRAVSFSPNRVILIYKKEEVDENIKKSDLVSL